MNFDSWLDQATPDTTEEIYNLYEAVFLEEQNGIWEVSREGTKRVVKVNHVEDALILVSDDEKDAFLKLIRERYMDGADDPEMWYGFQRNMDNPKA